MDIGYGFQKGTNWVSKQKICWWLNMDEGITWKAFLWYIADYVKIEDFSDDWMRVRIDSRNQREFFYRVVMEYDELMCTSNYEIDIRNDLWKSHKRGNDYNYEIIMRLVYTCEC